MQQVLVCNLVYLIIEQYEISHYILLKGGFKSEITGEFFRCQHKYSKSLSWAENLNKLLTVLGGKFKFSAQDSDLEYLCWQCKNSPGSSDLKPPLDINLKPQFLIESGYYIVPSPSITLINTYNASSKIISPNFIYWWTAVPTTCGFCWKQANDMLFEHFGTTSEKLILIRLPRKKSDM